MTRLRAHYPTFTRLRACGGRLCALLVLVLTLGWLDAVMAACLDGDACCTPTAPCADVPPVCATMADDVADATPIPATHPLPVVIGALPAWVSRRPAATRVLAAAAPLPPSPLTLYGALRI